MPIVASSHNDRLIADMVEAYAQKVEDNIVEKLCDFGRRLYQYARETRGYKDRTHNLEKSIGYVLYKDGVAIRHEFTQGDNDASAKGMEVANQAVQSHSGGGKYTNFCLVVVAGMEYAYYVENLYGYSVLAPAEMLCMQEFQQILDEIKTTTDSIKL